MKRRILSLLLTLCLIVGLLPAVAIPHAHAETTAVSATVTLFGTAVTIDNDETTTDIPDARAKGLRERHRNYAIKRGIRKVRDFPR